MSLILIKLVCFRRFGNGNSIRRLVCRLPCPDGHKKLAIPSYDGMMSLLVGNGSLPDSSSPNGRERKMNIQEALNIFGLSDDLTEKDIKAAYRKAALKYHPDRNPLGAELMKAVNAAFDFLMANIDKINQFQSTDENARYNYGEDLEKVLNTLSGLTGIVYEVIGNWVWISGETITHKETLKEIGCKWAAKKKQWFYRPEEHKSYWNREEHTIEEIRAKYGSTGQRRATGWQQVETRA